MATKQGGSDDGIDTNNQIPKPAPDVGYVYRSEPGIDMDDACLGTLARFPEGSVAVQTYDHVSTPTIDAGGVAFYPSSEDVLAEFYATFPDSDVWFDWDA